MNFYWVYNIPTPMLGLLVIFIVDVIGFVGLLATRPLVKFYFTRHGHHNEIAGYYFAAISLLYSLILGQVTSITYANYQEAKRTVSSEASEIISLITEVDGYPHPLKDNLNELLITYLKQVIETDWKEHRAGLVSNQTTLALDDLESMIINHEPNSDNSRILQEKVLDSINNVVKARAIRIQYVSSGLPATFWFVIVIGAILTISCSWLFYFPNTRLHLFLILFFSTMVGLVVFLSLVMDNPFRGDVSVNTDGYQDAIEFYYELQSRRANKAM